MYLYTALSGQFDSCVVVTTAQQVLHHHAVHAFLLPQIDRGRLVAAVLLQVFDATFTEFGTFVFRLDGLCSLQFTQINNRNKHSIWSPVLKQKLTETPCNRVVARQSEPEELYWT